ncbi:hypothetical protein DHEL01_v204549 [Diaporthe helianthi]|uniref:Uncharacterized protein n=1 Tax=Diaporthe helianthi TaxID=158607 RepID=A0A2P5I3H4_DIAHE|nr:hypothetical protein DHEL01_v204549 [Diaporthe helianthi]
MSSFKAQFGDLGPSVHVILVSCSSSAPPPARRRAGPPPRHRSRRRRLPARRVPAGTVYICEIAPPKHRGPLTSGPQFMTCLALVVGYFTSYATANIGRHDEADKLWTALGVKSEDREMVDASGQTSGVMSGNPEVPTQAASEAKGVTFKDLWA